MNCMTAFDTNVLIYCCDQNEPRRQERAFEILAAAEDGVLLWQVAVEFVAAPRKLAPQGFTAAHAWARLSEFLDLLRLVMPSPRVFEIARPLHQDKGVSFWDAIVIAACIDRGASTLYSEDVPAVDLGTAIQIVNPFR